MLKNPFALDTSTKKVVHIDDAHSAQGPFICAGCHREMRLLPNSIPHTRRGSDKIIIKRGHFAHVHQDACATGLETSLHHWAKMIIEEALTVSLPPHEVSYRSLKRQFVTDWTYHRSTVEEWQDGIRPDIVLHHEHGRLNVEILVNHAVDDRKADILKARCQSCIEINLSGYDFDKTTGDELRDAILESAPRIWISHQLESDRINILKAEWDVHLKELGRDLLCRMAYRDKSGNSAYFNGYEDQIASLGTGPFVGRPTEHAHWFSIGPREWQHVVLEEYLKRSVPNAGDERLIYSFPANKMGIKSILNPKIRIDEDPEVIKAAGLTPEQFGTPELAIGRYLESLCTEPDIPNAHPVARRIVSFGSRPGLMKENKQWAGYLKRRSHLRLAYEEAARRRKKTCLQWEQWYVRRIPFLGTTPRKVCAEGGPRFSILLAHLAAIKNMLNGGWPVEELLNVEEAWLRDNRRRKYNRSYNQGGGCHPYYADVFKVCASSKMMRGHKSLDHILRVMAQRTHESESEASKFLNTRHKLLGGATPIEFATDIPTMQKCIDLMPVDPDRNRIGRKPYKRIW